MFSNTKIMKKGDKVRCVNVGSNCGLTNGKVYKVLNEYAFNDGRGTLGVDIINDKGQRELYYQYRFELVNTTLEDDIKKATSFLGKKVKFCNNSCPIVKFCVYTTTPSPEASILTLTEFHKNGYVVALFADDTCNFPVSEAELFPEMIEVPLTDDYTAKVYPDKVVVGCQTITKDTFDKVSEAFNELNTNP